MHLVDLRERHGRGLGGRRQDRVDALPGDREVALQCVAALKGREVVLRRQAAAAEDACAHRVAERRGRVLGQSTVDEVGLGVRDPAHRHEVGEPERQGDGHDLRPEIGQDVERAVVGGEHLRRAAGALGLRHPGQPQPAHAAVEGRERVDGQDAAGGRVERVGPGDRHVEQGRIRDAAGQGPGGVQRRAQRHDAVGRDPADGDLQAGQPAERGRQAHRAAGVGADAPRCHPCRHRDAGAAARAAGGAGGLQVPGVPGGAEVRVGAPAAIGELHRVGLADDDHPLRDQAPGDGGGAGGEPGPVGGRAAHGDAALDVDQVLQRDRHPVERPDRVAGADRPVGALRREARIVGEHRGEGLELRLAGRDGLEHRLHGLDRRDRFAGNSLGELGGREVGEVVRRVAHPEGTLRVRSS